MTQLKNTLTVFLQLLGAAAGVRGSAGPAPSQEKTKGKKLHKRFKMMS